METHYLSTRQAGDYLGYKPKTIRRYVAQGELRPVNPSGQFRFTADILDAFLRRRRQISTSTVHRAVANQVQIDPDLADKIAKVRSRTHE